MEGKITTATQHGTVAGIPSKGEADPLPMASDIDSIRSTFTSSLADAAEVLNDFRGSETCLEACAQTGQLLSSVYQRNGKVMIAGNGGSMADSLHFAEELTGRFRAERRPLPAMALGEASHLTCVSNDYGFSYVFSRLVQAFGKADDVLIILSTSGDSQNLVLAAKAAREIGIKVVGLLGRGGGAVAPLCDQVIMAPGKTSDRIQEVHMVVLHIVIEAVERELGLA